MSRTLSRLQIESLDTRIRECERYIVAHGDLCVTQREDWIKGLGKWMDNMRLIARRDPNDLRVRYIKKRVPLFIWEPLKDKNHLSKLDKIKHSCGHDNYNDCYRDEWMRSYELLVEHKTLTGTTRIKLTKRKDELSCLSRWVKRQRERYRSGKMLQWQERLLNEIDFDWSIVGRQNGTWIVNYEKALEYLSEHGKLPTNRDKDKGAANLGRWVSRERVKYKKGKQDISREKLLVNIFK